MKKEEVELTVTSFHSDRRTVAAFFPLTDAFKGRGSLERKSVWLEQRVKR